MSENQITPIAIYDELGNHANFFTKFVEVTNDETHIYEVVTSAGEKQPILAKGVKFDSQNQRIDHLIFFNFLHIIEDKVFISDGKDLQYLGTTTKPNLVNNLL